jgi:hypothetical protein
VQKKRKVVQPIVQPILHAAIPNIAIEAELAENDIVVLTAAQNIMQDENRRSIKQQIIR